MKRILIIFAIVAVWGAFGAEDRESVDRKIGVKRIFRPERFVRGDENVRGIQEIDRAAWIWVPNDERYGDAAMMVGVRKDSDYQSRFFRFRCEFPAKSDVPLRIDVSADERFILYLDGWEIARGPHRGHPDHWFYESYEITLPEGNHTMDAVVWQIGPHAPLAQLSFRGGFVMKAEEPYDTFLTTGKAKWKVARLNGTVLTGKGENDAWGVGSESRSVGTSFASEEPFADAWMGAVTVRAPLDDDDCGVVAPGWLLFPSALPDQLHERQVPGAIRAVRNDSPLNHYVATDADSPWVSDFNSLLAKETSVTIPAHTKFRVLWDLDNYYCAYPELRIKGGRGAEVRWGWTESLRNVSNGRKGDRAAFDCKRVERAVTDVFKADGRDDACFTTPWWRCGRWCELSFATADDPLVIQSLAITETRYPMESQASFECDDNSLADVQRICTRGLQMCMHEMYFDCPYYEQHMYPGDGRVEFLLTAAVNSDERLVRQCMTLFDEARLPNGLVPMNFPSRMRQVSATYTMCWIDMFKDYLLWRSDREWLKARLPGIEAALAGLRRYEDADGLIRNLPGWSFSDYTPDWHNGVSPDGETGLSAMNSLQYVSALRNAAAVADEFGEERLAELWRARAGRTAEAVMRTFWDEGRGLMADTVRHDLYSEQAQCLAILSGTLVGEKREAAFRGLVECKDLTPVTQYFAHYLFETYFAFGRTDLFLKRLDAWRGFVRDNMCTLLEMPATPEKEARSDCHAWGAHPLYHLHANVLGVRPAAPFFAKVRISPRPGPLTHVKARTPHRYGLIVSDLRFAHGAATGTIELPQGLFGVFEFGKQRIELKPGVNEIAEHDGGAVNPESNAGRAEKLLRRWCDAMIAYQVKTTDDPRVKGAMLCPGCAIQHGRICDAAYPLTYMWTRTGNAEYLDAARDAVSWSRFNLTDLGGGRLHNDFQGQWWGITVFSQCAIGKTLINFGDRLPKALLDDWRHWFDLQTEFLLKEMDRENVFNVNYSAAFCEALALAWKMTGEDAYIEKGRKIAEKLRVNFMPDGMLAGESHPPSAVSPRGFRAVDLGYNAEESLPALYHFAELAGASDYADALDAMGKGVLEFVLPDGGIDNSMGCRAYKWTYYGSRTSDGALPLFAELAKRGVPGASRAASRHLDMLERCTSKKSGLLTGGLFYDEAGEGACIHHSFAHAKSLVDFLLSGATDLNEQSELPRECPYGVREFPTFGVTLASTVDWCASFSINDVRQDNLGPDGGGGSMMLLWNRKMGPILAGTMLRYSTLERENMQEQRLERETLSMTPRIVAGNLTNVSDWRAEAKARKEDSAVVFEAEGFLSEVDGNRSERPFAIRYVMDDCHVSILAKAAGSWQYVLPVVASPADRIVLDGKCVKVSRPGGVLRIESSVPVSLKRTSRGERAFTPIAGLMVAYLALQSSSEGEVRIDLSVEGKARKEEMCE